MREPRPLHILTINSGSSSLKFSLYDMSAAERLLFRGEAQRIGLDGAALDAWDESAAHVLSHRAAIPNHRTALEALFDWLRERQLSTTLRAVGHRVVHGGSRFTRPQRVDAEVLAAIRRLVAFDPTHLPQEIAGIEAVAELFGDIVQVVCFDTTFHRTMPRVAQRYALPSTLTNDGVMRYGFHGLSYEFILEELGKIMGPAAAQRSRIVIAHLGNGASMAAVRDGQSVETTMGFTPTGGLVMSTRSGDLDPGVALYLWREKGLSADRFGELINHESGLLAVSETSADVRDLLAAEATDARAREALALFCYQARKFIGALAAVLGGLDVLVFTAGIGEHAPVIRQRICDGLEFLGLSLDGARNESNAAVISDDRSRVAVRVIKTNEELMIARHTRAVLPRSAQEAV